MKKEIITLNTLDCEITILNNAPPGFEAMKSIVFKFSNATFLNAIKIPNLKYLDVIESFNELSLHLSYEPLREFFNNFIEGLKKTITTMDSGSLVIDKINKAIADMIKMAEREMDLSLLNCMGLYGELLQLKNYLLNNNDQAYILSGWNRPAPANHDFDFETEAIEIKTISKDKTTVRITSAFQLEAPKGKSLILKIYRIEAIQQSITDSLGDLYQEIWDMLTSDVIKDEFAMKCITDRIKYGGPKITKLPFKFILLEEVKYNVDQNLFPRIKRQDLTTAISNINYSIDLSAIENYKIKKLNGK
jgi:hypothetical protein